ncbi:c-type cytochrome [Rhodoplanes roseus]|uniref:Cytochrome c domain-containing protein n=1 Tax=Rhodoplanes roseus TaxID=29409 RepID=A0A327KJL8_9BRAD|nr:c-type cytochrome [Rhodoplanes roseus]RAI38306.1 hypothetical protein CH341_28105 [Rhodoplanes roseus]
MPRRSFAVALLVAAVAAFGTVGFGAGDGFAQTGRSGTAQPPSAARGAEIAQRWCATCHVTSADQTQATGEATPFPTIARRNSFDAGVLALFLLDPHPRMPDMSLTRAEAADLAAYVRSLAGK